MKDMLDRDIVVGDTLAMTTWSSAASRLKLYKVIDSAPFALCLKSDQDDHNVIITEADHLVICDWAR